MEYTLENILNLNTIREAERDKIDAELADLNAQLVEAEQKHEAALAGDDLDAMMEQARKRDALTALIKRKENQRREPVQVDREAVLAVWEAYAKDHNAELARLIDENRKYRKKAAECFLAMVKAQNRGLNMKAQFEKVLPGEVGNFNLDTIDTSCQIFSRGRNVTIDIPFYVSHGDLPSTYYAGLCMIVDAQQPAALSTVPPDPSLQRVAAWFGLQY